MPRRAAPLLLAIATAFAAAGWARRGHAQAPSCPLALVRADAATPLGRWEQEVERARARLARLAAPHDCGAVEVVVRSERDATLTFLTQDGRGAARRLVDPSELVPALEALVVTLPPADDPTQPMPANATASAPSLDPLERQGSLQQKEPLPQKDPLQSTAASLPAQPLPSTATLSPQSAERTSPSATPETSSPSSDAAPTQIALLVAITMGPRLTWLSGVYVAPVVGIRPSVTLDAWEIGIEAELSPVHERLDPDDTVELRRSTYALELQLGRRWELGPIALGAVGALGLQAVDETVSVPAAPDVSLAATQPRAALHGRLVAPSEGGLRFLADLSVDVALASLRENAAAARGVPELSRFGASLRVGVEGSLL